MIHIIDNFYLDADEKNFILYEWDGKTKTSKGGLINNVYQSYSYFQSFDNVLSKIALLMQRRSIQESQDLKELGKKLDQIRMTITEIANRMWPTMQDARTALVEPDGDISGDQT